MRTIGAMLALLLGSAAQESTVLKGNVKIKGDVPRNARADGVQPECAALHALPLRKDDILVDAGKNVRWAFVYVKQGLEGRKFEAPKTPVVVENVGCHYNPRVFGIMPGQPLVFRNGDDYLHNVHGLPFKNREFNYSLPKRGSEASHTFTQPEMPPAIIKCDLHAWMRSWAAILEHPFHAVTDEKGNFEIKGLPAGKYTIEVWHERYKPVTMEIEAKASAAAAAVFSLVERKEDR